MFYNDKCVNWEDIKIINVYVSNIKPRIHDVTTDKIEGRNSSPTRVGNFSSSILVMIC